MTTLARLLVCRFRLTRNTTFRFFHAPSTYAFFHARLGTGPRDPFPRGLHLHACESGRTDYEAGADYHIGLALTPDAELSSRGLIRRLQHRREAEPSGDLPLSGQTRLVGVRDAVSGAELLHRGDPEPLTRQELRRAASIPPSGQSSFPIPTGSWIRR